MPKKSLNFSHNRRSYLINRETFPRLAMILLSGVHNVGFSFLFYFVTIQKLEESLKNPYTGLYVL